MLHALVRLLPLIVLSLPVVEILLDLFLYQRYGSAFLAWLAAGSVLGLVLLLRARDSFRAALRGAAAGGDVRVLSASLWGLLAGARAFFAGLLLLFPGVLSDALALAIILLPGRVVAAPREAANDAVIEGEFREVKEEAQRLR